MMITTNDNADTCFWCNNDVFDRDPVYVLGKINGKNERLFLHAACAIKMSLKVMAKLEYKTRHDKTNFVLTDRGTQDG